MNFETKLLLFLAIVIGIVCAILYLRSAFRRARAPEPPKMDDFDFPSANADQPIEPVPVIYGKPHERRPPVWFGDEIKPNIDRLLFDGLPPKIKNPEMIEKNCPPMPAELEKMFDERFTKPRAQKDEGLIRLLNALNQNPLEDAIEFLDVLIETIEAEAEFDKPAPEGKTPRDGHSLAWHGYFVLVNARSYLKGEPILYIADSGGVYSPVFTREGENYLSTWEVARRSWERHQSELSNPGFKEVHRNQQTGEFSDVCSHSFAWDCPKCGARVNAIGEDMPEAIDHGGECRNCVEGVN